METPMKVGSLLIPKEPGNLVGIVIEIRKSSPEGLPFYNVLLSNGKNCWWNEFSIVLRYHEADR